MGIDLETQWTAPLVLDQVDAELLVVLLDRQVMGLEDVVVEELADGRVGERHERVDERRFGEGPPLPVPVRQLEDEVLQTSPAP